MAAMRRRQRLWTKSWISVPGRRSPLAAMLRTSVTGRDCVKTICYIFMWWMRSIFWPKSTSKWLLKSEINMIFNYLREIFFSWCKFFEFSHSLGTFQTHNFPAWVSILVCDCSHLHRCSLCPLRTVPRPWSRSLRVRFLLHLRNSKLK